jgi:hypothetical protein
VRPRALQNTWCPTCRRQRPCTRHPGTTDWQSSPVHTCLACGQVIHEATLASPIARHKRTGLVLGDDPEALRALALTRSDASYRGH